MTIQLLPLVVGLPDTMPSGWIISGRTSLRGAARHVQLRVQLRLPDRRSADSVRIPCNQWKRIPRLRPSKDLQRAEGKLPSSRSPRQELRAHPLRLLLIRIPTIGPCCPCDCLTPI